MEMSRGDNVIRYDAVSSAVSAELVLACQRNGWLMRGGSRFDRLLSGGFVCCFGAGHGGTC